MLFSPAQTDSKPHIASPHRTAFLDKHCHLTLQQHTTKTSAPSSTHVGTGASWPVGSSQSCLTTSSRGALTCSLPVLRPKTASFLEETAPMEGSNCRVASPSTRVLTHLELSRTSSRECPGRAGSYSPGHGHRLANSKAPGT
jgi:hypothetical protein